MSMRKRSRLGTFLGLFGFFVVGIPACSAVLGIDALPKAGEVLLDAAGTCAELNAMAAALCGPGGTVVCDDAANYCAYYEGGVPEGSYAEGPVNETSMPMNETGPNEACPTMSCSETGVTDTTVQDVTQDTTPPPIETGPEGAFDGGFGG